MTSVNFARKIWFSTKISILDQNFDVLPKVRFWMEISILDGNFDFGWKFRLLTKIWILNENFDFERKFRFLTEISKLPISDQLGLITKFFELVPSTNRSGSSSHALICDADGWRKIMIAGTNGGMPIWMTSRKLFFSNKVAKKSITAITVPWTELEIFSRITKWKIKFWSFFLKI